MGEKGAANAFMALMRSSWGKPSFPLRERLGHRVPSPRCSLDSVAPACSPFGCSQGSAVRCCGSGWCMCSLPIWTPLFRSGPELQPHNPIYLQPAAQGCCSLPLTSVLCWGSGAGRRCSGKCFAKYILGAVCVSLLLLEQCRAKDSLVYKAFSQVAELLMSLLPEHAVNCAASCFQLSTTC